MDIIHQIASVTKAISDAGNHELYQSLQDISVKAYDLTMENLELKEKIRNYEEKEKEERVKEFKNEAYYFNEDGPFCTKCYDDEGKKIRLMNGDNFNGLKYKECPKCKNVYDRQQYEVPIFL